MSEALFGAGGQLGSAGGMIELVWVPDPKIIAAKILELAGYLENFIPPLEASRGIARQDMQHHFDTESGPDGGKWAPHADSTIDRWGEHSILQLTGAMHDAAVSEGAYVIDGRDLFIDTSAFPDYWVFHETGRGAEALAEHAAFLAKSEKIFGVKIESAGTGTGAMPARPFVGLSFEAQMKIIEAFDAWFEGGISGFYTGRGGTVQTRTSSGQFGKAITGGG
jgi:hypothetical protein